MSTTSFLDPVIEAARALLANVDHDNARAFLPVIDSAAGQPPIGEPSPFPLGDYPELHALGNDTTRPMLEAIAGAASSITWWQSDAARVPPGWVERSGATQLIGPDGTLVGPNQCRLGLFYLSPDLLYPDHWHDPDEFYLILAGSVKMSVDDRVEILGPGDFSVTPSGAVHSLETTDTPMLAMWGWSGDDTSFDSYSY